MQEDHTLRFIMQIFDAEFSTFIIFYKPMLTASCNLSIKNLLLLGIWWSMTTCMWPGHSKIPVTIFTHMKVTHPPYPQIPTSKQSSICCIAMNTASLNNADWWPSGFQKVKHYKPFRPNASFVHHFPSDFLSSKPDGMSLHRTEGMTREMPTL